MMKMNELALNCGDIDLSFVILDDGRIRLSNYGNKNKIIDCSTAIELGKFVEIGAVGFDHEGHHGVKHSGSFFGEHAIYVSHSYADTPEGRELVIVTEDGTFRAATHFLAYRKGAFLSVYNEVTNISGKSQTLEYVSSLYLYGFDEQKEAKELFLGYATNGWHMEAQWSRFSFFDLGIYDDKGTTSPKRWHFDNVGSWPSKEYLPMLSLDVPSGSLLLQIESNGSWDIEIGGAGKGRYLFTSGPNMTDSSWTKTLAPKEMFIGHTTTISFGKDFEEALGSLTDARRLMLHPSEDAKKLPVIFNSYMHALWDLQTEETLKPLIDIASEAGCETFCIDAGWFSKDSKWWDAIGDWKEEKSNFPHGGLAGTLDYIRSKGMKAGFWIEIENVGERSSLWKKAPKSWFLSIGGTPIMQHERHCLDFANPEVFAWAIKTIDRLMELYHLDYLKTDYNVDAGVGSDKDADSLGDGLLKHNRAVLRFYDEIERKYPYLTIEGCASGGARLDYETLRRVPIVSTSDQTNYRLYPYIAGNVLTACLPEQAAVWAYPVDSARICRDITDEDVAMNMVNAMLGRIHLASYINRLPKNQMALVKEGVEAYKMTRSMKTSSHPLYPSGLAHFGDPFVSAATSDGTHFLLNVWNTSGKPLKIELDLSKYELVGLDVLYPKSLKTDFSFDKKSGLFNMMAPVGYFGRSFIGKIK